MRVAFYARYSTDRQSEHSIEDQMRNLKTRAEREGWHIVQPYSDAAISGATLLRPGIQALMSDAAASRFDIVLCEALDRLSRNQADIARIYEQLSFHGVKVVTLSEGAITELHIGLKGTMNALFLKDLADKTRRGLEGRVRAGKSGGGKAYGYDVPVRFDGRGERITGECVINEREAGIVRRIFKMYANGASSLNIAHTLNAEKIYGPNGTPWGPSTINGNSKRGTGILNNELYIGRRVWNRLSYVKDPSTGKRVSRQNPKDKWVIDEVPELRIVSEELWQAVKDRQDTLNGPKGAIPFYDKRRPRHFWTGKVRCGCCGGGYIKISKDLLGCATSRNKGKAVCSNRKNIRADVLEDQLLTSLQHHLMKPECFAEFIDAFREELSRTQLEASGKRKAIHSKIKRIDTQLDNAIKAIFDGADSKRFREKMDDLEAEKLALQSELAVLEQDTPLRLHPNMTHAYKAEMAKLVAAFQANRHDREALEAIRDLLDTVVLHPVDEGFEMDVTGELAAMLRLCSIGSKTPKPSQLSLEGSGALAEQVKMVAGAGFEPATFRL